METVMTEKLYGLEDIPEGWFLCEISRLVGKNKRKISYDVTIMSGPWVGAAAEAETPQLALHKAILKARGEV
jgi:hypothetical protein